MLLILLILGCEEKATAPPAHCQAATTVRVATDDGAAVGLHHHPGQGPPVLLVHGIASNHRFWDLDAEHSLALWLVEQGYDAWLLDLRGHGDARWGIDGKRQWLGWTIDDYGQYDVDAAVRYVQAATGYQRIAYVGHSMGGMVGAIYMVRHGTEALSTMIAVGSPADFDDIKDPLLPLARAGFSAGGTLLLWVSTPAIASAAAGLNAPKNLIERLYNPANMEPEVIDPMLRTVTSPMSRKEMRHFSRMLKARNFQDFAGEVNYTEALGAITTPTLVIAGEGDGVAALPWVKAYAEAMGGETKLVLAGRSSGFVEDYGHLDLGLGARAETEIFPILADWINAHPPQRP